MRGHFNELLWVEVPCKTNLIFIHMLKFENQTATVVHKTLSHTILYQVGVSTKEDENLIDNYHCTDNKSGDLP